MTEDNKDTLDSLAIEERRRAMLDADAKRDAQRQMTWIALFGMVSFPLLILIASGLGLDSGAQLLSDTANIYVVAVSAVLASYFGFNALETSLKNKLPK
jgi:hypothetical protein